MRIGPFVRVRLCGVRSAGDFNRQHYLTAPIARGMLKAFMLPPTLPYCLRSMEQGEMHTPKNELPAFTIIAREEKRSITHAGVIDVTVYLKGRDRLWRK
jgi:hypothetical protein